jgi:POT family
MRGDFGEGGWSLKADQMQIVNPLLILILVPIFESLIYPCFSKCNLLTPLQRMATGGIIAGIAFVISGVVELQLEVSARYSLCLITLNAYCYLCSQHIPKFQEQTSHKSISSTHFLVPLKFTAIFLMPRLLRKSRSTLLAALNSEKNLTIFQSDCTKFVQRLWTVLVEICL